MMTHVDDIQCRVRYTRFAKFSILVLLQVGLSVDANVDSQIGFASSNEKENTDG